MASVEYFDRQQQSSVGFILFSQPPNNNRFCQLEREVYGVLYTGQKNMKRRESAYIDKKPGIHFVLPRFKIFYSFDRSANVWLARLFKVCKGPFNVFNDLIMFGKVRGRRGLHRKHTVLGRTAALFNKFKLACQHIFQCSGTLRQLGRLALWHFAGED